MNPSAKSADAKRISSFTGERLRRSAQSSSLYKTIAKTEKLSRQHNLSKPLALGSERVNNHGLLVLGWLLEIHRSSAVSQFQFRVARPEHDAKGV